MPAGRPTEYSPKVLEAANAFYLKYLKAEPFLKIESSKGKFQMVPNRFHSDPPWIEELALELDVDDETISEWAKRPEATKFSATVKKIKTLQKMRLYGKSMDKNSAAGGIFLLKANHGMIETEKRILAGDKDNPVFPTPILGGVTIDVSKNNGNK